MSHERQTELTVWHLEMLRLKIETVATLPSKLDSDLKQTGVSKKFRKFGKFYDFKTLIN